MLRGTTIRLRSPYGRDSWHAGRGRDGDHMWVQPRWSSVQLWKKGGRVEKIGREREITKLVVPNWVFSRLLRIPWTPRLTLMNAMPTKVNVFVQAGSALSVAILGCPDFQKAIAAAMVKRVAMKEPMMSHIRRCAPILSPIRPRKVPALNARREQRACWSALWNVESRWFGGPSKSRARASASW